MARAGRTSARVKISGRRAPGGHLPDRRGLVRHDAEEAVGPRDSRSVDAAIRRPHRRTAERLGVPRGEPPDAIPDGSDHDGVADRFEGNRIDGVTDDAAPTDGAAVRDPVAELVVGQNRVDDAPDPDRDEQEEEEPRHGQDCGVRREEHRDPDDEEHQDGQRRADAAQREPEDEAKDGVEFRAVGVRPTGARMEGRKVSEAPGTAGKREDRAALPARRPNKGVAEARRGTFGRNRPSARGAKPRVGSQEVTASGAAGHPYGGALRQLKGKSVPTDETTIARARAPRAAAGRFTRSGTRWPTRPGAGTTARESTTQVPRGPARVPPRAMRVVGAGAPSHRAGTSVLGRP
jgi:hypothetical protein